MQTDKQVNICITCKMTLCFYSCLSPSPLPLLAPPALWKISMFTLMDGIEAFLTQHVQRGINKFSEHKVSKIILKPHKY